MQTAMDSFWGQGCQGRVLILNACIMHARTVRALMHVQMSSWYCRHVDCVSCPCLMEHMGWAFDAQDALPWEL